MTVLENYGTRDTIEMENGHTFWSLCMIII